ncbi:MAG: hypothetical protein KUG76_08230 [Gammaproteobacteria bacterium]|nr:hypothetical protein [Gammaproteobacteria bacterium]
MTKSNKFEAFFVHLLISLFVFIALYIVIKNYLYPGELFSIDGGKQGLVIIALVDLVLGPLLTLIVYKKGKPGLIFDLSLIGIFQLSCLALGMSLLINERPLALVLSYDGFHTVGKPTLDMYGKKNNMFDQWPGSTPKNLYVSLPVKREERLTLQLSQLADGPLYVRENLLKTFDDGSFNPYDYGVDIREIIRLHPGSEGEILAVDEKYTTLGVEITYMTLNGKYGLCFVVFDIDKNKIMDTLSTEQC